MENEAAFPGQERSLPLIYFKPVVNPLLCGCWNILRGCENFPSYNDTVPSHHWQHDLLGYLQHCIRAAHA